MYHSPIMSCLIKVRRNLLESRMTLFAAYLNLITPRLRSNKICGVCSSLLFTLRSELFTFILSWFYNERSMSFWSYCNITSWFYCWCTSLIRLFLRNVANQYRMTFRIYKQHWLAWPFESAHMCKLYAFIM